MNRCVAFASICMILVLVAIAWGTRDQPQETSSQTRWEYRVVSYEWLSGIYTPEDARPRGRTVQELEVLNEDIAQRMTDLGRQGWELVCCHEKCGFLFKRRMR